MKFETPATTNPIDQLKVVGQPVDRIDGLLKTTGTAPYAYERHDVVSNPANGYIVGSAIAKGRIRSIDGAEARKAPGVIARWCADHGVPMLTWPLRSWSRVDRTESYQSSRPSCTVVDSASCASLVRSSLMAQLCAKMPPAKRHACAST